MPFVLPVRIMVAAGIALAGTLTATILLTNTHPAAMQITPVTASVVNGEKQTFNVVVESRVPVNTFSGEVVFDTEKFQVVQIDYNTSIANLWVEEPWYNRSENSIYFAGGTTARGGFVGKGVLLTVTLQAKNPGTATISLRSPRILAHDGLGQDIPLVTPLDSLFTIDTTPYKITLSPPVDAYVNVENSQPTLDINADGTLGFQDISILLTSIGSNNPRHDFTGDGRVTWADIRAWQRLREAN